MKDEYYYKAILIALEKLRVVATEFGKYDEIKANQKAKREVKTNEHPRGH